MEIDVHSSGKQSQSAHFICFKSDLFVRRNVMIVKNSAPAYIPALIIWMYSDGVTIYLDLENRMVLRDIAVKECIK
jgi:hypothetical protein